MQQKLRRLELFLENFQDTRKSQGPAFLKYVFFPKFKNPFHLYYLDRRKLFQMIVSDEFLKQCETEAFLKFNSSFSTEFARLKNTYVYEKLL